MAVFLPVTMWHEIYNLEYAYVRHLKKLTNNFWAIIVFFSYLFTTLAKIFGKSKLIAFSRQTLFNQLRARSATI